MQSSPDPFRSADGGSRVFLPPSTAESAPVQSRRCFRTAHPAVRPQTARKKRLIICLEIILLWKPKCTVPGPLRLFYNGIQIASLVIRHARRALRQRIFIDLLDLRRRPASVSKGRLAVLAPADRLPDAPCVLLSVSDQILAVGAVVFTNFSLPAARSGSAVPYSQFRTASAQSAACR